MEQWSAAARARQIWYQLSCMGGRSAKSSRQFTEIFDWAKAAFKKYSLSAAIRRGKMVTHLLKIRLIATALTYNGLAGSVSR